MAALFEKYLDEKQYPSYRLKNKVRLTIATTLARGRAKNILKTEAPFLKLPDDIMGKFLMTAELTCACPQKLDAGFTTGTDNSSRPSGLSQMAENLHRCQRRVPTQWIA
jgi:hypothetical protein